MNAPCASFTLPRKLSKKRIDRVPKDPSGTRPIHCNLLFEAWVAKFGRSYAHIRTSDLQIQVEKLLFAVILLHSPYLSLSLPLATVYLPEQ